jgi:hypothetical protein
MTDDLQKITKLKVPCNGKMCKNKWNGLNSNYKKVTEGTSHHIPIWGLTIKKCDHHYLPRQINREFYDIIQAFHGERLIMHQDT